MARDGEEPQNSRRVELSQGTGVSNQSLHKLILGLTLLFVVLTLLISSSLVVYTAWLHDLRNGLFALVFAVFSARIAMNWLLWKDEKEPV